MPCSSESNQKHEVYFQVGVDSVSTSARLRHCHINYTDLENRACIIRLHLHAFISYDGDHPKRSYTLRFMSGGLKSVRLMRMYHSILY